MDAVSRTYRVRLVTTSDQDKTLDRLSDKYGNLAVTPLTTASLSGVVGSLSGDVHAQTEDDTRAWRIAPDGRAVSTLTRSSRCYCEASYCDHAPGVCGGSASTRYVIYAIDYIGQACPDCIRTMQENGGGEYVHELPTDDERPWCDS